MGTRRIVRTLLAMGVLVALWAVPTASAWDGRPHRLHHHPRSAVILSFRFGVPLFAPYYYVPPPYVVYRPYPYASGYPSPPPPYTPPAEPAYGAGYGQIRIEVEPGDVAISLDGQFLGLARDFRGVAVVTAAAGEHLVELTLHGYTSRRPVRVGAGEQVLIRQALGSSPSRGEGMSSFTPSGVY